MNKYVIPGLLIIGFIIYGASALYILGKFNKDIKILIYQHYNVPLDKK